MIDNEKRNNLIMKHTRRLKQKVGSALTLSECRKIIERSFSEGYHFKK